MTNEELIREIVSKVCPFHGKRAIINVYETWEIKVSACCKEFQEFLESMIKNKLQKESMKTPLPELPDK